MRASILNVDFEAMTMTMNGLEFVTCVTCHERRPKSNVSARIQSKQHLGILFCLGGSVEGAKAQTLVSYTGHHIWERETKSFLDFLGQAILNISHHLPSTISIHTQKVPNRIWETFELNQLKSAPSQLLPVFPGFDQLQSCCS